MTRDDLLEFGRKGDPYRFVPMAHRGLDQCPEDAGIRFLLATNYARLMLKTAAMEQLSLLPDAVQRDETTRSLVQVLAQLPDDRLSEQLLWSTLSLNLRALEQRSTMQAPGTPTLPPAEVIRGALADWLGRHDLFRARSLAPASPQDLAHSAPNEATGLQPGASQGHSSLAQWNILVRQKPASGPAVAPPSPSATPGDSARLGGVGGVGGWCSWVGDARAAILDLPIRPGRPGGAFSPITVEGLYPPLLLQRVYAATNAPEPGQGYRVPIRLVQADLGEFAFGLALADLTRELSDPRLTLFIGPDAAERLGEHLQQRIDLQILGPAYVNAGIMTPSVPHVHEVITGTQTRQQTVLAELRARVASVYGARTPGWYAHRLGAASDSGDPIRVLVPTCRYSTFIRHSARDIARAFEALGCRSMVLEEPDDFSHLAAPSYLRAYAEFQPDLVVLINYTRANLSNGPARAVDGQEADSGNPSPSNVPFVCWIQDAMPHLFDERIGASQTAFDFLAGHIHDELRTRYGYPNADVESSSEPPRALSIPVLIDSEKFYPEPAEARLRDSLECEVAFASHHSLPPRGLHEQILSSGQIDRNVLEIFERLFPLVRDAVDRSASVPLHPELRRLAVEVSREVLGVEPVPGLVSRLVNNYIFPVADRMIRHDTIAWASAICRRRSWRLRLHGRGWDQGAFAEHACGELSHGEQLRASYQAAACHIHASIHWPYHQRVMECAASGGLPIYRFKHDDLTFFNAFARAEAAGSPAPRADWPDDPEAEQVAAADHPELLARLALLQRLGDPHGQSWAFAWNKRAMGGRRSYQGLSLDHDSTWLFGDPAETAFRSESELERVIERAAARPVWRANLSAGIRSRVLTRFTYRRAASDILTMVRRSMSQSAGTAAVRSQA